MKDKDLKLVIGALLHDIGKIIYSEGNDRRNHADSGYEYIRKAIPEMDPDVLDCIRFHHAQNLQGSDICTTSPAYIVYMADNIASAADRREKDEDETGFVIHSVLQPVFNILNGNKSSRYYSPMTMSDGDGINYPVDEKQGFTADQYKRIVKNITENIKGINREANSINSLLEVLEANLCYVPSSTSAQGISDISLFDHMKLTAAIASCISAYAEEKNIQDLKEYLFQNGEAFYGEEAFLLASFDVSGIQSFIYTIASKNALKTLRSRSFYLEIMMEHIVDEFLTQLGLSRANLIYSGGGHCYMLIPNTGAAKEVFDSYVEEVNNWFLQTFKTALYIAGGYAPCSSNSLNNQPEGAYSEIFRTVSSAISKRKIHRYSAKEILALNAEVADDYGRECRVCKRIGHVNAEEVCPVCQAIEHFSANVLYSDFFSVSVDQDGKGLPLPGGYKLTADTEESLKDKMAKDPCPVRIYGKNRFYTGQQGSTKLWVGSYTKGNTFEEFAQEAKGIDRIAILRADVDNLGHAFVAGFDDPANHNRYVTLTRTAALSRQLTLFFKRHINKILEKPTYSITGAAPTERNVTIVYSGGDDLFLAGSWNDVIEAAVDIRREFAKYSEGTLTLSAGIGLYQPTYPIRAIASEMAESEEKSKDRPGKNAVTLLDDGVTHVETCDGTSVVVSDGTYTWDAFEEEVIGKKYALLDRFFAGSERGMSFMYHLLELIRRQDEKINFARYVYLLARMEPDHDASPEEKEMYRHFSVKMCEWVKNESDRRHLKTAMTMYAYMNRSREE